MSLLTPAGSPTAASCRRGGGRRSTPLPPRSATLRVAADEVIGLAGRAAEPHDVIDRAPPQIGGGVLQIALLPAFADLALQEADIGDDVLHALAGVAGQLLREIARASRASSAGAVRPRSAAAPGLLDRGMDRLEGVEVAVGDGGVVAAIVRRRRRRRADRARHPAAGPGQGEAAPGEQPNDEQDQRRR